MRFLLICLLAFCSLPSLAAEPKITVSLSNENPLVGQVTTIKVKVLVPTWFAKPLYFDEIDTVNVINLKGNKSTYPTSERFGSSTWTGVIKEYPVIAMAQGQYNLQLPTLNIQYMGDNNQVIARKVTLDKVTFKASVPAIAQTLKPLIIAENITMSEDVEQPKELTVGQSIQRKIKVNITESSALFIPPLMHSQNTQQQQSYPANAQVNDTLNDRTSTLTGTRLEQQDILIKQAGTLSLPAISLQYYQPSSQTIQYVEIEGYEVSAASPPATLASILWKILAGTIALALLFSLYKVVIYCRQQYQHSEYAHFKQFYNKQALTKSDYAAYIKWRNTWQQATTNNAELSAQEHAISLIYEQVLYNDSPKPDDFDTQLLKFRKALLKSIKHEKAKLAALNP